MINRFFSSVLIVTSAFVIAFGQKTETKKEVPAEAPQAFSFAFAGDGAYLGVQTQEVNKDNFSKFGLREVRGVAVEKVSEGSPAAAAGIKEGDVIVRFNGDEVTSSRKLSRLVGEVDPDHQVKVTVIRNGSEQEITATLAKRPMAKFSEGNFKFDMPMGDLKALENLKDLPSFKEFPALKEFNLKDMPAWKDGDGPRVFTLPNDKGEGFGWRVGEGRSIGVGITPLGKQLAQHFGVDSGAMINEVRENSPAAKAGLKAGDIIVEANGKPVKGDFELIREINGKKEGDVQLTIVRDGKRQTISVTPEASKDSGFLFRSYDENGLVPAAPLASPAPIVMRAPAAPLAPMAPMAPIRAFFPGRII